MGRSATARTVGQVAVAAWLLVASDAGSQTEPLLRGIPPEHQDAYRELLRAPNDLALLYRTARRFEEAGLYASAIRLYSRMLMIDGSLAPVRLRLAYLHFLAGDHANALAYLDRAVADAPLPADLQQAADDLRERLEARLERHRIEGRVRVAWRYQTNANAAPDDGVQSAGEAIAVATADRERSDHSLELALEALHVFDPKLQSGITLETTSAVTAREQFEVDAFDMLHVEATTGPRLPLYPGRPAHLGIRPHLRGEVLLLRDGLYSVEPGLGLGLRARPRPSLRLSAVLAASYLFHGDAARSEEFETVPARDADDRDGLRLALDGGAHVRVLPRLDLFFASNIARRDARNEAHAYHELGVGAGATVSLEPLEVVTGMPASVTLSGGYTYFRYFDPDPLVSDQRRRDHYMVLQTRIELPVTRRTFIAAAAIYERRFSSIPNFDRRNTQLLASFGLRF